MSSGRVNKGHIFGAFIGTIIGLGLLAACQPVQDKRIFIDLGDAEDYADWLEYEHGDEQPKPFKADPLVVTGQGKVKAIPDIAVITARISSKNKNESVAFGAVSEVVNAVQNTLDGRSAETGFTALSSSPEYDETCRNENQIAWQRHREIVNDFYFNKRLDDRGDTKTKRRAPKPRIKQAVCAAQTIEVSTDMVIRLSPPDDTGAVLQALSQAGVETATLYGYDFSNYDALYQEAASQAAAQARKKAEMIARITKAELGEIVGFNIGRPARTGRFGPQPAIVNRAGRNTGAEPYVMDRDAAVMAPAISPVPMAAKRVQDYSGGGAYGGPEDEIIVTATRIPVKLDAYQSQVDAVSVENFNPVSSNNALNLSLLSGPQTITVSAVLQYDYKTVIDGTVVVEED